jgi:hypothetical protein
MVRDSFLNGFSSLHTGVVGQRLLLASCPDQPNGFKDKSKSAVAIRVESGSFGIGSFPFRT